MNKKFNKIFAIIMCFIVILSSACSNNKGGNDKKESEKSKNTEQENKETKVIKDHTNKEVVIPKHPKRVLISSIMPLPSVYCLYRGGPKDLIGIPKASMSAAKHSYLAKVYPEILKLESEYDTGGKVNIEEVMKLKPDLVLYRSNKEDEGEMYKKAGIPAVGFSVTIGKTNTVETLAKWLELLQDIFGETDNSAGIVNFGRETLKNIQDKIKDIPEDKKPTAIVFSGAAGGKLKAAGGNIFANFWINQTGGRNIASELKGAGSEINMEQLLKWNPDIILINNFCPYVPEDFLENKIEGYDFSNLKAVQNKKVYKYPLGMYRWYPPASDTPLCLMWMAKHMQPEIFKDVDMDKEVKDYYKKFYKHEIKDEDLKKIYNPPREAAAY